MGIPAVALLSCAGCLTQQAPPPEAVLEGVWELTTTNSTDLSQLMLTFDGQGELTKITYRIGVVTIDANTPTASTKVDGDDVTIAAGFGLNSLFFHGTLNADRTVIVGQTSLRISLLAVTVTVDGGPATLSRR